MPCALLHRTLSLVLALRVGLAFASPGEESALASSTPDTARERAQALLALANAEAHTRPGESLQKIATAIAYAERSGDNTLLIKAVRQQRDLEYASGAYDQFLLSAIRAASISEQLNDRHQLADDLGYLRQAYERVGAFDKAVDVGRRALFLLRTTDDGNGAGKALVDLMDALVHAGRFNEVISQGDEALTYYAQRHDTLGQANVWLIQGEALIAQQRQVHALPMLVRAERVFRYMHSTRSLCRALCDLVEVNNALERWPESRALVDSAMALAEDEGTLALDPKPYLLSSQVYEGQGRFQEALRDQKRFYALRDSLFNDRVADRMLGLQALYSSDRKDAENSSLRKQNEANEAAIATARSNVRWWLLASALMLAAVVALVLMGQRLRRLVRRARLRQQVIQRQAEEIKAKHLELERQNLRLTETLISEEEKDILLKEIHHRVKNNLQIVNTLLKMQSSHVKEPALTDVLDDCQGRVRSMAMIHEHIYRCGDLNRINVKAHINALAQAILKHAGLQDKVTLDLTVTYDRAALDNLIPLSLLLNELLTNSVKHAFTGREKGRIQIALRRMGGHECELIFSDDGVGMATDLFFQGGSFGMDLVRTLAAQLNGRIRLLKGEGTTFQMSFVPEEEGVRKAS